MLRFRNVVVSDLISCLSDSQVRTDYIAFPPGIYALTGVNGSGKSTFFRVLMSCDTNEKSIDLPSSIILTTPASQLVEKELPKEACLAADDSCDVVHKDEDDSEDIIPKVLITMPSSDVVEISQSFYWPLYTRPVDWIYQCHLLEEKADADALVRRAAEELQSLEFRQTSSKASDSDSETEAPPSPAPSEDTILSVMEELVDVKEDWFNDLSGGQKSKVELVRKVRLARLFRTCSTICFASGASLIGGSFCCSTGLFARQVSRGLAH
jgi:hypothetical protein